MLCNNLYSIKTANVLKVLYFNCLLAHMHIHSTLAQEADRSG